MQNTTEIFNPSLLKNLYKPHKDSNGEDNGQVTIVGGSSLFHGAPLLSLLAASRIVDMVFFASPEPTLGEIAAEIKSRLFSFIWVPWEETEKYIEKSDAVLIGPGLMRFKSEHVPHEERGHVCDEACQKTRTITKGLLSKFPDKKWVIDAGSLQTMVPQWIPKGAIVTPNRKEYELLFSDMDIKDAARQFNCTIVLKGPVTIVASPDQYIEVQGGNAGLTKGGTGDVQAGITVSLLAKNDSFLAASSASFIVKAAADTLFEKVGTNYSADDLANQVPETLASLL